MKATCKHCGDTFKLEQYEADMVSNGEILMPDTCEECCDMMNSNDCCHEQCSDADSGL